MPHAFHQNELRTTLKTTPQIQSCVLASKIDEVLQYILKMIENRNNKHPSIRNKWSQEEIEKLCAIYEEEILKGKKQLWKRVCLRINQTVRKARRQAIEYKWKNYCSKNEASKNKICKNEALIEQLLEQIPYKGYSQLAKSQNFENTTQSNLKNVFYSTIRSLAKFITKHIDHEQDCQEVLDMLANRTFLRELQENKLNLINFRRSINNLKIIIQKNMRCSSSRMQISQIQDLRMKIQQEFKVFKELYSKLRKNSKGRFEEKINKQTQRQAKMIQAPIFQTWEQEGINQQKQLMMPSSGFLQDLSILNSQPSLKNYENSFMKLESFPSIGRLFNDF